MNKIDFGKKWVNWIRWCIPMASFLIVVNENATGFSQSSRGLRQGDRLSPYLFVLAMEALSWLIGRGAEGGFLSVAAKWEVEIRRG